MSDPWSAAVALIAAAPRGERRLVPARPAPNGALPGQTGIRLRQCLIEQDAAGAIALLDSLDPAHHVELLLGAALRDARGDFLAARLYTHLIEEQHAQGHVRHEAWALLVALLTDGAPDEGPDLSASAWIAARRAPDRWFPLGAPLAGALPAPPGAEAAVVQAYAAGVGGLALLAALADRPLHAAVATYYRLGSIHALGPRPLFMLAAS